MVIKIQIETVDENEPINREFIENLLEDIKTGTEFNSIPSVIQIGFGKTKECELGYLVGDS